MVPGAQHSSWQQLSLAAALAAALVVGVRLAGLIGATVPGFLLSGSLYFDRIGDPQWPSLRSGLMKPGDQVVAVRVGERVVPVRRPRDVAALVASQVPGTAVTYQLRRDGEVLEVPIPTARFSFVSFLALYGCSVFPALFALLLAVWAVRRQPQHPASWRFFLLCGVAYAANLAFCERIINDSFDDVYTAGLFLLSGAFVNFAFYFPRPRPMVERRPWIQLIVFGIAGAAALIVIAARVTGGQLGPLWDSLDTTTLAASEIFVGVATAQSYWQWTDRETRERARVGLFGYAVVAPMLGFAALPGILTGSRLPANLFFPLTLIMNACLAYAIVRGNLFELRHVLRRRSLTVALVVFWVVVFFTAALLTDTWLNPGTAWARATQALLVVGAGLGFAASRAWLQRWVDRMFFRARVDYKPTVQELSASLTRLLDADEVLRQAERIVQRSLGGGRVEVLRLDGTTSGNGGPPGELRTLLTGAAAPVSRAADPHATAALAACHAEVAVPISFGGRPRAALLLGPKRSGELYTSEDLDLLGTIANQAAIALENAYSFEELDRLKQNLEREVELRTRELRDTQAQLVHADKMASLGRLVAGVAHELNNPLGAVDGNLVVLGDYVDRLRSALAAYEQAAPAQRAQFAAVRQGLDIDAVVADLHQLLATCTEGSQRARRIVQDLRTFSRLDEAELQPIDLNAALGVSLDLLHHRLHGPVRVETEFGELPPVECYASQINQVFLNLLTNAVDAVEGVGGGCVRVTTRVLPRGSSLIDWVEIAVHDTGPGVAPELCNKIFDPFFTTKPVGKGTGLGLSISYSIVGKHGGSLTLDTAAPGCTFRMVLPTHPQPPSG